MFVMEIKIWIIENYKLLVFFVGLFCFALAIISMFVRSTIKQELKDGFSICNDKINDVSKLSNQIIENNKINNENYNIHYRITREIIIPSLFNTENNKQILAKSLLNVGFRKDELIKFGIDDEIIKIFELIYLENEANKLKQNEITPNKG